MLSLRFVDTKGKLTRKTDIEFHVLQKSSQLEGILLGLNFLVPALSEIKFKDMTISLKIDKMFYKIPFVNEECTKVYFMATDYFQSGAGMLMCHCSDLITEANYYSVPEDFQSMLGSSYTCSLDQ